METPKPESKLAAASEYALIFGAGASAAMSLAAQQVAAASVPVTALVAIGLMNRRRLDRRIKAGQPFGPLMEERSAREQALSAPTVTAQPLPLSPSPPAPGTPVPPPPPPPSFPPPPKPSTNMTPAAMSQPAGRAMAPVMSPTPQLRLSPRQQQLMAARKVLEMAQSKSLQRIGSQLQQARINHGFTLQDIHHQTYIQRYALQAIESGDLDALPEPFYIRAFIKKYAIALGLPGAEIAGQFPTA
ncbi:MAG: helix-turn-helix domain-containing protein [Cyanobacteria bacterium P01_D01_bin.71]